jgi:predicted secreted protein
MLIGSALAIYFIIWWLTLFAVLPFGARSQQEAGRVVAGSEPGAPESPRILRLLGVTTLLSAGLFGVFWAVYVLNVFDLAAIREMKR